MSIDAQFNTLKADIALVRDQIRNVIEPESIEDTICKGFTIWYSKMTYRPPFLFIGINPGAGYYNHTGIKYRESDLEPTDVFEYCGYGGGLAEETIKAFKKADRLSDLEKSSKINIHYLLTSNQKELFLLQGILIDKYKINMYEKAKIWTKKLIEIINPECIMCEGAYPAKKIAEYYKEKIEWENDICEFSIKGIPVFGYKRLFSRIINKDELAARIARRFPKSSH